MQQKKVKAAGAAPRKYIYYYKKHNLQYEINHMWNLMLLLRTKRWNACLQQTEYRFSSIHVIANDHLWAGPWTLIWSASSWRTALLSSSSKCSRYAATETHLHLIHQSRNNAWSRRISFWILQKCFSWPTAAKRIFLSNQYGVYCRSNELHLHFWRGRLWHPHQKVIYLNQKLEIVLCILNFSP